MTHDRLRVLLVNPPPFEVVEPWYDRPRFGRQGLACLAGYLRVHCDCEIRILDAKFERLDFAATLARITEFAPAIVGLTAFTNEIKPAARVARELKARLPGILTVIGGVHVSVLPEHTLREFPEFDIGCVGEGEVTLAELCVALQRRLPLDGVAGLILREGALVHRTAERPKIEDLDLLPPPAWDLLPRAPEYWVMSQRGCPFTCKFCVNPNGRLPRQHSVGRFVDELSELIERYRPEKLHFADEIFTVDMPRTHRLLDEVICRGLGSKLQWWAETHVRFVDEPLLAKMKEAGCSECALGVETGDEASYRAMGKGTTREMVCKAFAAAHRAELRTIGFFIFGHPNESPASIRRTVDLAVEVNPTIPIFGLMVPYPGTEIARMAALGEGGYRLVTDDWDQFNKQVGGSLVFAGLTRQQIELLQLTAYVEVFVRNRRFAELARFVWNYRMVGFRVLRKLVTAPAPLEDAPAPLDEAFRRELVEASTKWSGMQSQSVRQLRRSREDRKKIVSH